MGSEEARACHLALRLQSPGGIWWQSTTWRPAAPVGPSQHRPQDPVTWSCGPFKVAWLGHHVATLPTRSWVLSDHQGMSLSGLTAMETTPRVTHPRLEALSTCSRCGPTRMRSEGASATPSFTQTVGPEGAPAGKWQLSSTVSPLPKTSSCWPGSGPGTSAGKMGAHEAALPKPGAPGAPHPALRHRMRRGPSGAWGRAEVAPGEGRARGPADHPTGPGRGHCSECQQVSVPRTTLPWWRLRRGHARKPEGPLQSGTVWGHGTLQRQSVQFSFDSFQIGRAHV